MKKVKIILFAVIFLFLGIIIEKINNREVNVLDNDKVTIKKDKNMLSMMLETEAKSGNYVMTARESWPTDGYVFNSKLSVCEHGSELSWDDINKRVLMSGNVSDKCYVYFDVYVPPTIADFCSSGDTLATCVKNFGDQGPDISNIYIHSSNLTNGAGDNSYRYAGASDAVNNFVCFGSDATPCPADNLYRIIGVFEDKVKLIKYDYATSTLLGTDGDYYITDSLYEPTYKGSLTTIDKYGWNNSVQKNTWSESNLNKINLNTNFITNIGSEWANKIATTTWKVGGNTYAKISEVMLSEAYQNEITNAVTANTTDGKIEYNAKIGLMYVSDYGFAAAPSSWIITLYNYSGNVNGLTIRSLNWMYMGYTEWSISRNADASDNVFRVNDTGYVDDRGVINFYGCRPAFSLEAFVTYGSGFGTSSDPIIIGD